MKIIGCLNMREKDGGQSSVTVGCVYLPVSFFNACTSDYLRTERLFLQRPISPQMASRCFSYFAALLLEIRNIAFFIVRFSNLTKGRVFSSESKENVRCSLFQNGCNHLNYSLHSFLLLSKSVAANNKNLYRTASLFGRQALFADAFGCLNSWFNPGNLENKSGITPKYTVSSYEELYRIVMEPEELENIGVRNRRHSNEALL